MSTAAAFNSIGYFPFCPVPAHAGGTSYVGGLTLAQAMAFFWNLETVTFTFAGTVTATATSGGGSVPAGTVYSTGFSGTITPTTGGHTGDFSTFDTFSTSGSITVVPKDRVCNSTGIVIDFDWSKSGTPAFDLEMQFRVIVDPGDSSKFAIEYFIFGIHNTAVSFSASLQIGVFDPVFGGAGYWASGTFSIAGITFDYRWYYVYTYPSNATFVTTGGTLGATSGSFTY